jgi:hypothetical protein
LRIEMHDHHEGGAGVVGKRGKEGLQRLDSARRCADADDDGLGRFALRLPGAAVINVDHRNLRARERRSPRQ